MPALPPPDRRDFAAALALALAAVAVFWPATGCDFVNYDDPLFVTANRHVLGGPTADNLLWALDPLAFAYWIPVTWLSYQLDVATWGRLATGFHVTNLLVHAANTGLFFLVLRRLGGGAVPAVVAAAVWGLHPQHVETVAWVSERKGVLSAFFGLLAVWAYARYAAWPTFGRMAAVVGWLFLSLASKPMLVSLPVALLVLDGWPLGRLRARADLWPRVREKWPMFLLAVGWGLFTAYTQTRFGAVAAEEATPPPLTRAADAVVNYAVYARQAVWPVDLAPMYPRVPRTTEEVAGAFVLLAAVTAAAVAARRAAPAFLAGWLWFVVGLLPVAGLVTFGAHAYADRNTYWPHLGLFAGVVWGVATVLPRVQPWTAAAAVTAAAVAVGCAVETRSQIGYWANSLALWEHGTAVAPEGNFAGFNNLGRAYEDAGQPDAAARCYDEAVRANPAYLVARFNKVRALYFGGRLAEAEAAARDALAAGEGGNPDPVKVSLCWTVFGDVAARGGKIDDAAGMYREGLRHSDQPFTRHKLGLLLLTNGRPAEAVGVVAPLWSADPTNPEANFNLAWAYGASGDWASALPRLEDAARGQPNNPVYRSWLGVALLAAGRTEEARTQARQAARSQPNWAGAWAAGAWAFATDPNPALRNPPSAALLAGLVRLVADPPGPEVLDAAAAAAAGCGRFDEAVTTGEAAARAADAAGNPKLAAAVRERVALYRGKKPYHQPAPKP